MPPLRGSDRHADRAMAIPANIRIAAGQARTSLSISESRGMLARSWLSQAFTDQRDAGLMRRAPLPGE